jgi:DnaJ like chaperone protein
MGKIIGAILGFIIGRVPGAIIGFIFGLIYDVSGNSKITYHRKTSPADYSTHLLMLIAAVLKADGKILRSELDYVKQFLIQSFGVDGAQQALLVLRDLLNQEIALTEVCQQIRSRVDYSSRLQLLHFLYGVANADGKLHPDEERVIAQISVLLGITDKDRGSILAMFRNTIEDYYKILEIEPSASNDDVKKAYRKMAVKYHPDKVAYLGEDVKKAANEKFQKLNAAYEKIKKERGMV